MRFLAPVLLLLGSNCFMTYAWYGHLRDLRERPLLLAVLVSWGVAFFEYCLQVPANRLGYANGQGPFTLGQLKVTQELITMVVFAAFAFFYMRERLTMNYGWASLCLVAAAYFIFKGAGPAPRAAGA